MRIALFILGTVAVIYLMVKGFKQVLEESREHRTLDHDDKQPPQQLTQQRNQHSSHADSDTQHRSEEHTSELQSRGHLVCRLLLEKKKKIKSAAGDGSERDTEEEGRQ